MSDLMKYLPEYYTDVKEFNYLMQAETPEIDNLWAALFQLKANQFILSADAGRIRQWEKLLNIKPDYSRSSLEQRKAVVIMKLSTRPPLTYRWLIDKLIQTVGEGNFEVSIDYDKYELDVSLINETYNVAHELKSYLREKIPANLTLLSALKTDIGHMEVYVAGAVYPAITSSCLPELVRKYNYEAEIYATGAVCHTITSSCLPELKKEYDCVSEVGIGIALFGIYQTTLPDILDE